MFLCTITQNYPQGRKSPLITKKYATIHARKKRIPKAITNNTKQAAVDIGMKFLWCNRYHLVYSVQSCHMPIFYYDICPAVQQEKLKAQRATNIPMHPPCYSCNRHNCPYYSTQRANYCA